MAPPTNAIAEILLRLPADDPACLAHASVVCKLWRSILSDPKFPYRYREFHRTPPLLGFLHGFYNSSKRNRFVPITTRIPFLEPAFGCRGLDCRHGRVLFDGVWDDTNNERGLAMWDPTTGNHKLLTDPDPGTYCCSGAVLCAAAGCNHHGCHGGPFLVVLVSTPYVRAARAWVYSSQAPSWSAPASVQFQHDGCNVARRRAAIVGDQIYFLLSTGAEILKYDLGKHCLTLIGSPGSMYIRPVLMTMEHSSSLGFIGVKDSTLHLWATMVNPDGSLGWVQDRLISLNNLVSIVPRTAHTCKQVNVIGFAEGVDVVLLSIGASGFIFDLKSETFRKLKSPMDRHYYDFLPYMTFYIPVTPTKAILQVMPKTTFFRNIGIQLAASKRGTKATEVDARVQELENQLVAEKERSAAVQAQVDDVVNQLVEERAARKKVEEENEMLKKQIGEMHGFFRNFLGGN